MDGAEPAPSRRPLTVPIVLQAARAHEAITATRLDGVGGIDLSLSTSERHLRRTWILLTLWLTLEHLCKTARGLVEVLDAGAGRVLSYRSTKPQFSRTIALTVGCFADNRRREAPGRVVAIRERER